jgi:hypothetical protein
VYTIFDFHINSQLFLVDFHSHTVHAHRRAATVNCPNFKFKNTPFYRTKPQGGEVLCSMWLYGKTYLKMGVKW